MSLDNELKNIYKIELNINNISNIGSDILLLEESFLLKNLYISGITNIYNISSEAIHVNGVCVSDEMFSNKIVCNNIYSNVMNTNYLFNISNVSIINNCTNVSNINIINDGFINICNTNFLQNSNNSIFLNNVSMYSIIVNENINCENLNINNNLYISNNSSLNNIIINNTVNVSDTLYINNNNNTNLSEINNIYNINICSIDNLNANNIFISGNTNIENINYDTITTNNILNINKALITETLNISNCTIIDILECNDSLEAQQKNIPLWGFYRTGGILRLRIDTTVPVLDLIRPSSIYNYGTTYKEYGVTIYYTQYNPNIINSIYIDTIHYNGENYLENPILWLGVAIDMPEFNSKLVGNHIVTYKVYNNFGTINTLTRTVTIYRDRIFPAISLIGEDVMEILINTAFVDPGVISSDNMDIVTPVITGNVDVSTIGSYIIKYNITDYSDNSSSVERLVYVVDTINIPSYNLSIPTLTFLQLNNNYNNIISNNWYVECWVNITDFTDNNTLVDFSPVNYDNDGTFNLYINGNGYMGIYFYLNDIYYETTNLNIELNTWTKLGWKRNQSFIKYIINDIVIDEINIKNDMDAIKNISCITIGKSSEYDNIYSHHLKGSISEFKLYIDNILLFNLDNNYKDSITDTILYYPSMPVIESRSYTIIEESEESSGLVFHLKASEIGEQWKYNDDYLFIPHPIANNVQSIVKNDNIYGWSRNGNIGWILEDDTAFNSIDWDVGITLEQWVFIDHGYIPLQTSGSMILAGQSSLTYTQDFDYGFCLFQSFYHYNTYPYNMLSFSSRYMFTKIHGDGKNTINLNNIRGKWAQLVMVSTHAPRTIQLYLNGILYFTYTGNRHVVSYYPDPRKSVNKFTVGCSNAGNIHVESYNNIFFGDVFVYSRPHKASQVLNNYKNHYDTHFVKQLLVKENYNLYFPYYDISQGYMKVDVDLNFIKFDSWTIEYWLFIPTIQSPYTLEIVSVNNNRYAMGIQVNGRTFLYHDPVWGNRIDSAQYMIPNGWNHYALVRGTNYYKIYVNGNLSITSNIGDILSYLTYPTFANEITSNFNGIAIGGEASTIGYDNTLVSQIRISNIPVYTQNFTPSKNLKQTKNTVSLLDKNFMDIATNKYVRNFNATFGYSKIENPQIILNGDSVLTLFKNIDTYVEEGATFISSGFTPDVEVKIINNVDVTNVGIYVNRYYTDYDNTYTYSTRIINVISYNIPPVITLNGSIITYIELNESFIDLGYLVTNNIGETIIPVITGSIDNSIKGEYKLTYTATDSYGNTSYIIRTIIVTDLPISNMFMWVNTASASNIIGSTQNVSYIYDSKNSIKLNKLTGTVQINKEQIIGKPMLDLTTSSLKSESVYQTTNNSTFAIIIKQTMVTTDGFIFGHLNTQNYNQGLSFVNNNSTNVLSNGGNSETNLPITLNTPIMYIGVMGDGKFTYLKMIDLNTGIETISTNLINTSPIIINDNNIYIGSDHNLKLSKIYVGEIMYWKRVLKSNEIYNIEYYLYNKWKISNNVFNFSTILPTLELKGESVIYLQNGIDYYEQGITIYDPLEKNTILDIVNNVDKNTNGIYIITYTITTSLNETVSIQRSVNVSNTVPIYIFNNNNNIIEIPNINLNIMNNANWTVEVWLYITSITDFTVFNINSILEFKIKNMLPVLNLIENTNNVIEKNKWVHLTWMRKTNFIYTFVNGKISIGVESPIYLNELTNLTNIIIGTRGKICQPSIESIAKYDLVDFYPNWYISPNINNLLLWFNTNIEIISQTIISVNLPIIVEVVLENILFPILTFNGSDKWYISLNAPYKDFGVVSKSYIDNLTIDSYIFSILDENNNELLTENILSNNTNIINLINTGTESAYTIKYKATDNISSVINTIERTIYIISDNIYSILFNNYIETINYTQTLNSSWTFELWMYPLSYPTVGNYSYILDTDILSIVIDNIGDIYILKNSIYTKINTNNILLNKWMHLAVVYDNNLKCFINGKISNTIEIIISDTQINSVSIGSSLLYTNKFIGKFLQPLITNLSKYILDFIPNWYLNDTNSVNNLLYWCYNNIELISEYPLKTNNYEYTNSILAKPLISLIGNSEIVIMINTNYIENGILVEDYILQSTPLIPYITSILRNDEELLSAPIELTNGISLDSYILTNNIYNYVITYTVTGVNGIVSNLLRTITILTGITITPRTNSIFDKYKNLPGFTSLNMYGDKINNKIYVLPWFNTNFANYTSVMSEYLYTSDGINWTMSTFFKDITPMSYAAEMHFNHLGIFHQRVTAANIYIYYHSLDGITWTTRYTANTFGIGGVVVRTNDMCCWARSSANNNLWISFDTFTWYQPYVLQGNQIEGVLYNNGVNVLYSRDLRFTTSVDALTWEPIKYVNDYLIATTPQRSNFNDSGSLLRTGRVFDGKFIICSYSTYGSMTENYIISSEDAITWTYHSIPVLNDIIINSNNGSGTLFFKNIMYLNKLYIILIWDTRNNEQYIITSPDLDTWTYEYPFYENNDINYILSGVSTFGAMTGVYTTNYYTIT